MVMNKTWSENLQSACAKVDIKTAAHLHRKLKKNGLDVVQNTVWRWWRSKRRPSTKEQHVALDKVLKMKHSERLFFFDRD